MPKAVHFDIQADDPERVKSFYAKLFGRKFERPMEAMEITLRILKILKENLDEEETWEKGNR